MSQDFGISSLIKTFKGTVLFVCGVIKTLAEDSTLNIDNILNAIRDEAHHLLKVKASAGKEVYDITPDIADALKDYIDFKHSGISDIDAFLAQQDMFANRPSLTASIMREFFAKKASQQQIADTLREYAKLAMLQDNDTPALFETEVAPRERLWELAVNKATGERFSIEAGVSSTPSAEEVAEARRQYDEVVARYTNPDGTKKAGWMKAPNGKPTNLTEEQWVWVRTPNFKKWFGDWEALAEIEAMKQTLAEWVSQENLNRAKGKSREEIFEMFGNDLEAISYIDRGYLQHLGKDITDNRVYSGRGYFVDHAVNHHPEVLLEDYEMMQDILLNPDNVFFDDRHAFDSLIFTKTIQQSSGEKRNWSVVVSSDAGKIVVHKTMFYSKKKNQYASLKSVLASNTSLVDGSPTISPEDESSAAVRRLSALNDTHNVPNFLAPVNPSSVSKVVDENGEPLVVWHASSEIFNTFSKGGVFHFGTKAQAELRVHDYKEYLKEEIDELKERIKNAESQTDKFNWSITLENKEKQLEGFESPQFYQVFLNIKNMQETTDENEWEDKAKTAKAMGYDGMTYYNVYENDGKNSFAVFNPNQIKSATDNIGTFDPENPDIRYSVVTDSEKIAELEASPKITGYRTVVLEPDGTLGSPMASGLRIKGKKKQTTSGFTIGNWEQSEERPELADDKGKIDLVKPSGKEVRSVDYNPYIHSRLDCVNSQFKDAWQRPDLVYIENEIPQTDLDSKYHAEKAAKPVGIHKWNGGDLILSRYDKPIRIVPWEEVADDWVKKFKDRGVEFDIVSPQLLPILEERGVEILPPHKNMGDACNAAYREWIENKRVIVLESNDVHARHSITAEEDRAYLDAVRRGDMETAQRMVREAAKAAGYTIEGWHGDRYDSTYTVYDESKTDYHGFWVWTDAEDNRLEEYCENFPRGQALPLSQISGHALNINSIRNVLPKDTAEWLHWIEQGKLLYTYKEKVQAAIDQQRINLADVDYLNLDKNETILDSFTNPQVSDIVPHPAPTVNGRTARGVALSILLSLMSRV